MSRLILIRHSAPTIDVGVPPNEWNLSDEGRQRAKVLAGVVSEMEPLALFSSDESKAIQTAEPIEAATKLKLRVEAGFKEHRRDAARFASASERDALVEEAIRRPDDQVMGLETAGEARDRFARAVQSVTKYVEGDIAIVSHGTVMALFIASLTAMDPVEVWRGWGLPGFAVVNWPAADRIEMRWNYGGD